ncbi:MAG: hypothetical protein IPM74_16870 [Crocinitomicaceae bacterium]|nr:hypothetical protein [Crocinitomicaceae bacterium]
MKLELGVMGHEMDMQVCATLPDKMTKIFGIQILVSYAWVVHLQLLLTLPLVGLKFSRDRVETGGRGNVC